MLRKIPKVKRPEKAELDARLEEARVKLSSQQMRIKEAKLPVIVLIEGWGASGKGSVIGRIINTMDPRFFKVETISKVSEDEARKPFLYRYFRRIPEAGRFTFFDSGWIEELANELSEEGDSEVLEERIDSVNKFERTLCDNGYVVMKFFMHISEKEQRKRLEALEEDKNTKWRVSKADKRQNRHYDEYFDNYSRLMKKTNQSIAPWYVINATDKKWAELQILEFLNEGIDTALLNHGKAVPILQNTYALEKMPLLKDIDLNKELTEEEYRAELKFCQDRLSELHNIIYRKKIPVIIAYEGWDAAGKGGNIKRVTSALDPRGYEVFPIASPEPHEKNRHFLWRFWTRLPKDGHIAIYDRTWYGRVMVERLEGFCSENDWRRAYNEINEFERELYDWGAIIIKFWVQIDKDTQLERFTDRQNTPEKQWKITDEDWRNREKWDLYEEAIDEMIKKTSTDFAPWHILESNDKKYARIKALRTVIAAIEERL